MLNYFKHKRHFSKVEVAEKENKKEEGAAVKSQGPEPVVDDELEAFLERIVSEPEGPAPPLPDRPGDAATVAAGGQSRGKDAQKVLMQGADTTPLPDVPDTPEGEVAMAIEGEAPIGDGRAGGADAKRKNRWSWWRRDEQAAKNRSRADTADTLASVSSALKSPTTPKTPTAMSDSKQPAGVSGSKPVSPVEAKKEEDEIKTVLEQLNLAAVNNRVFSISDESKDLLKKFSLVLKDLVNGVPTAMHDLESLLTNSDQQIQRTYKSLPPFLQELVEKLPEKFTGALGAEAAGATTTAAAAEKEEQTKRRGHAKKASGSSGSQYFGKGARAAEKLGIKLTVPGLKDLLTRQGSAVALLRSVLAALRTRFPALMGVNVLWSLALFVLLLVFWYCHKRGRETRLERERRLTEDEMAAIAAKVAQDPAWEPPPGWDPAAFAAADPSGRPTTTAPAGAGVDELRAGMLPQAEDVGEAAYAPEGSLAKALREEQAEKERQRQKLLQAGPAGKGPE